jgi:hypothetical protein
MKSCVFAALEKEEYEKKKMVSNVRQCFNVCGDACGID